MSKIVPTEEQNNAVGMGKIHSELKISAFAGAAKTSTLVLMAMAMPVPSLVMTFNKALADEAKERFPSWCECRTTHSLAYASFGASMQHKLKRPQGAYRNVAGTGTEIAKYFKTGDFIYKLKGENESRRMKLGGVGVAIKETCARFEQSADEKMSYKHVSTSPCDNALLNDDDAMRSFKYLVLKHAIELWRLRTDLNSPVMATHDTYLKLFQLSKPDLSRFEIIYLDEMQDTNAVVMDIFLRQMGRSKLIGVGDRFQNIYSWRGAENGMEKVDWPEAQLTKSFRFGQHVADLADIVLADNGVLQTQVKGFEKMSTECYGYDDVPEHVFEEQYAKLFRTNGALIFAAIDLISEGKRVNLEIDVSDFVKLLESAIALYNGDMQKVKHESLVQFTKWSELQVEAEVSQGELLRVHNMVVDNSVHRVLRVLSSHKNFDNPDVILTTAHKSKGREWNIVILGDDFPLPVNKKGEWTGLIDGERNLLYVALTRAKGVLVYNQSVEMMIARHKKRGSKSLSRELGKEFAELNRILP